MIPTPIPVAIDVEALLRDLASSGWRDQKIELALGFSPGYIAKLRQDPTQPIDRAYGRMARLYNLWCLEFASAQTVAAQTT